MKNHKIKIFSIATLLPLLMLMVAVNSSCNKFVDTPTPTNQITTAAVFTNNAGAVAAISGVYYYVTNASKNATIYPAYFADEMLTPGASSTPLQAQENTYDASVDFQYFQYYYQAIYGANSVYENASSIKTLTDSVASQVKGEARFLRAYSYFKLVNFYGAVPLVTTTDVNATATLGKSSVDAIYQAMIADLNEAYNLVSNYYPSTGKVRVNKSAVSALLAKVYLYHKDWALAETAATKVITSNSYSLSTDPNTVFLNGSSETLWQLWNANGFNLVGSSFNPSTTSIITYQIRPGLLSAFEANDKRKSAWTKAGTGASASVFYPYKYKQRTANTGTSAEYLVQLRLGELYLIRAEARAQQNNLTSSLTDLNVIRTRAGLANATSASQADLLLKIEQERRIELMFEEGNRWFDLNRTGRTAFWLTPIKANYSARANLLAFPTAAITNNPNLVQNPGY